MDSETLRYYEAKKGVTLQVDASQDRLGAAIVQDFSPVAFATRVIYDTQKRYVQIQKNLLAIVFTCERYHPSICLPQNAQRKKRS